MTLTIATKKVVLILVLVVLVLNVGNLFAQLYRYSSFYYVVPAELMPLLDVNGDGEIGFFSLAGETNLSAWYSSSLLLVSAILLLLIASSKKSAGDPYALHWTVLSIIFVYLSLDETATIHERVSKVLKYKFDPSGFFYYAWVMPAIVLLLILIFAYIRFLFNLPVDTRRLLLIAGMLYIGGALGLEMIEGRYQDLYGSSNVPYTILTSVEETLEMFGIIVLIYALMSYISKHLKGLHLYLGDGK